METIEHGGRVIEITHDLCAQSPRDCQDNFATLVCNHRRYALPIEADLDLDDATCLGPDRRGHSENGIANVHNWLLLFPRAATVARLPETRLAYESSHGRFRVTQEQETAANSL